MTLDTLGLTNDDLVRWKPNGGKYNVGRPLSVNDDGSILISVIEGRSSQVGKCRSIVPSTLERRERGPRGGELWVPLV